MSLLVPIVHEERVAGPDEAAALYQALGVQAVTVEGFQARTPAQLALLVNAIAPDTTSTVTFEGGTLDEIAFAALRELVLAGAGYLDVGTAEASLRVWPTHARVYRTRVPDEGLEAVARAMTSACGRPIEIGNGSTTIDENTSILVDPSAAAALDVRLKQAELAFRIFERLTDTSLRRGFINAPNRDAVDRLLTFLQAIHASVSADLELEPAAAARYVRGFTDCELRWQAEDTFVTLPEGSISTSIVAPFSSDDEKPWREDIARALRKARSARGSGD